MMSIAQPIDNTIDDPSAWNAPAQTRATFLVRTYLHLTLCVISFVAFETVLLRSSQSAELAGGMTHGMNWLLVLGIYLAASLLVSRWTCRAESSWAQYSGLFLQVFAETVLFLPLFVFIQNWELVACTEVLLPAAVMTSLAFFTLSGYVWLARPDFSCWRHLLAPASVVVFVLIVWSVVFQTSFGILLVGVMVLLSCAHILYVTSRLLHHYRPDQHVAASVALFVSIALLFWYAALGRKSALD
jgi:FtsH-binding integral membrane protein